MTLRTLRLGNYGTPVTLRPCKSCLLSTGETPVSGARRRPQDLYLGSQASGQLSLFILVIRMENKGNRQCD